MPRLSNAQYLATRIALKSAGVWLHSLDMDDFLEIHRYFAPTKAYTDEQALAHRRALTDQSPSLPNHVGKILRKPMPAPEQVQVAADAARIDHPAEARPMSGRGSRTHPRNVHVRAVRLPEPDLDKLARLLIRLAREDAELPEGKRRLDRIRESADNRRK